jgi:hypothetical protein
VADLEADLTHVEVQVRSDCLAHSSRRVAMKAPGGMPVTRRKTRAKWYGLRYAMSAISRRESESAGRSRIAARAARWLGGGGAYAGITTGFVFRYAPHVPIVRGRVFVPTPFRDLQPNLLTY